MNDQKPITMNDLRELLDSVDEGYNARPFIVANPYSVTWARLAQAQTELTNLQIWVALIENLVFTQEQVDLVAEIHKLARKLAATTIEEGESQ